MPRLFAALASLILITIVGVAVAWAQEKDGDSQTERSVPQRLPAPPVVPAPNTDSILVDEVPDRERTKKQAVPPKRNSVPEKTPAAGKPSSGSPPALPQRLPAINDLQTPYESVPHILKGEYSTRKPDPSSSNDRRPVPPIEVDNENSVLPIPQPALRDRVLREPPHSTPDEPSGDDQGAVAEPDGGAKSPAPEIDIEHDGKSPAAPTKPRSMSKLLPQALRTPDNPEHSDGQVEEIVTPESGEIELLPSKDANKEKNIANTEPPGRVIEEPSNPDDLHTPAMSHERPTESWTIVEDESRWEDWQPWWQEDVRSACHLEDPEKVAVTLHQLMSIALHHSPILELIRLDQIPLGSPSPGVSQFTLCYTGSICASDGLPSEAPLVFYARARTTNSGDASVQTSDTLLRIAQAYWNLHRLRGHVSVLQRSLDRALELQQMAIERGIDIRIDPHAAVLATTIRQRRASVNAKRIDLKKIQNKLAFLVSVPGWQNEIELMPQDVPCQGLPKVDETHQTDLALLHRHEVQAALAHLNSNAVRRSTMLNAVATQDLELTTDRVRLDVKDAILTLRGNFAQMRLQQEAAIKATRESEALKSLAASTSVIEFAAILHAQETRVLAEQRYIDAEVGMTFAALQLRRATGTLLAQSKI